MEQMPDMSFKPVQSPLALVAEQQRLKQQAFENQRQTNQDQMQRIQQVSSLASSMVQTMVSAAHQRQLQQGLQTLASTTTTTPQAPITMPPQQPSPDSMGLMPAGASPTSGFSTPTTQADNTYTPPPVTTTTVDPRKLAALKMAQQMAPEKFGEAIVSQALPGKPKDLQAMAVQDIQRTGKISPQTEDAMMAMAGAKRPTELKNYKVNGENMPLNFKNGTLFKLDGTPINPAKWNQFRWGRPWPIPGLPLALKWTYAIWLRMLLIPLRIHLMPVQLFLLTTC